MCYLLDTRDKLVIKLLWVLQLIDGVGYVVVSSQSTIVFGSEIFWKGALYRYKKIYYVYQIPIPTSSIVVRYQ